MFLKSYQKVHVRTLIFFICLISNHAWGAVPKNTVLAETKINNNNTDIILIHGSVAEVKFNNPNTAAIVNAANEGCLGGGGIDGVITKAGGADLKKAREALPIVSPGIRCPTGDAKITISGNLKNICAYVIHAVGPHVKNKEQGPTAQETILLKSAYTNALIQADSRGLTEIAFCPISTSIFGYPPAQAAPDSLQAMIEYFDRHAGSGIKKIYITLYAPQSGGSDETSYTEYTKLLKLSEDNLRKELKMTQKPAHLAPGIGAWSSITPGDLKTPSSDPLRSALQLLKLKLLQLAEKLNGSSKTNPTPFTVKFDNNDKFFAHLMDMSDTDFNKNLIHNIQEKIIKNPHGLSFGTFTQPTIAQLHKATQAPMPGAKGTFNLLEGAGNIPLVDVRELQANPENKGAVFQVASNFNCLETTSPNEIIENTPLEHYLHDHTQGPFASISAAPGLIWRRYMAYPTEKETWQRNGHSINLLDELMNKYPEIQMSPAGYVNLWGVSKKYNTSDDAEQFIKIGLHTDVQVTYGYTNHNYTLVNDPTQIIHQVFTAAVNFDGTGGMLTEKEHTAWGQVILNAAYEGTLHAAEKIAREKKQARPMKVFLTLIGGGVFANDKATIVSAITRMSDFIKENNLEVWLVNFNQKDLTDVQRAPLLNLVKATGGKHVLAKAAGLEIQLLK